MKLTQILGILIIVLSPITVFGLYVDDLAFWYVWDIIVIVAAPIIGVLVIFKLQPK